MPVVESTLGVVAKKVFFFWMGKFGIGIKIAELQKPPSLGTTRILRKCKDQKGRNFRN